MSIGLLFCSQDALKATEFRGCKVQGCRIKEYLGFRFVVAGSV